MLSSCGTIPSKPPVTVVLLPVDISHHTHPPGRPPVGAAHLALFELGVCVTRFPISGIMQVEYPRFGYSSAGGVVASVSMTIGLSIEVWATEGREAEVLPHEETHRAISEHYFQEAEAIAHRLGRTFIGRKVVLPAMEIKAAVEEGLKPLQEELLARYEKEVKERCDFAQTRFDEITDNGRAVIGNKEAMTQAIAEEEAHWTSQSGTSEKERPNKAPEPTPTSVMPRANEGESK